MQTRRKSMVRVAAVQYEQGKIASWTDFEDKVRHFAEIAASYSCDFILYPELLTLQLLSMSPRMLSGQESIKQLTLYSDKIKSLFQSLALDNKINVILGSHPSITSGSRVRNSAYVFMRDGAMHVQDKIHATPSERDAWQIEGGDTLDVFDSEFGKFGILICYDSEFPELGRALVDKGASIIFVPFCTDEKNGYLRVRYCSQARAIENQCYMVLAGNVGTLSNVFNMDIQYGNSAILTPCDFPFARDGVAAVLETGVGGVIFADLDLAALDEARRSGTVQNLKDRRKDLYEVHFAKS